MRWYSHLTRYHWFVLIVAALGWLFDSMDQQLFNIARVPAISDLLARSGSVVDKGKVEFYSGVATSIFLMGWATGGLFFGQLGDRIGRARTMVITILLYSACTGLSAFSQSVWDFAFYRFLTGLGVGGEFAVGVALVAEAMPDPARPHALGLLQALSAVGNIGAAIISLAFGHLEQAGTLSDYQLGGLSLTAWRAMFLVGAIPALLALVIRRRLHEPDSWKQAARSANHGSMGSYQELFGDRKLRRNALLGMLLAMTGVIGLWGIGFFSIDLQRSVFRKTFEAQERESGSVKLDQEVLRALVSDSPEASAAGEAISATSFIDTDAVLQDAVPIASAILACRESGMPISKSAVEKWLDSQGQTPQQKKWRSSYLESDATQSDYESLIEQVEARSTSINGRLTRWTAFASLLMNAGGFIGMLCVSHVSERLGRRSTFALSYIAAGLSTAYVFLSLNEASDIYWMMPVMGACLLSLFGGYAIYLPELFPTRLRSTGTSFCYNVGRFAAAAGPFTLGWLTSTVFTGYPEPMRQAGMVMCSVFVVGLLIVPFIPETRGKALPE